MCFFLILDASGYMYRKFKLPACRPFSVLTKFFCPNQVDSVIWTPKHDRLGFEDIKLLPSRGRNHCAEIEI
jgi:hypothetical protein